MKYKVTGKRFYSELNVKRWQYKHKQVENFLHCDELQHLPTQCSLVLRAGVVRVMMDSDLANPSYANTCSLSSICHTRVLQRKNEYDYDQGC